MKGPILAIVVLLFTFSAHALTITEAFVGYLNDHRISIGLEPIVLNADMTALAKTHSTNMALKKVAFGHTGFSTRCSRARLALGGGNLCAENVAMGQTSGKTVFAAWMKSSGHRANIENPRLTHMGFAYSKSAAGTYYWTNLFLEKN